MQSPCGRERPEWVKQRGKGEALLWMKPEGSVGARPPDHIGLGAVTVLGAGWKGTGKGALRRHGSPSRGHLAASASLIVPTSRGRQGATGSTGQRPAC